MTELRYYQREARDAVLGEWAEGRRKTVACLPTGTGKTIIFSSILDHQLKDPERRGLILAHRGELLAQAADKLRMTTGLTAALEQGESSALGAPERVTVGSIQSLSRENRLRRFPRNYFTDIILDECHHALSSSYQRVLNYFDGANVLGVTATPDRGDKRALGEYFDSLAYEYTLQRAIQDGFLVPIRAQLIPLRVDLTEVEEVGGDYDAGSLGTALDPYLEQIAKEMKHYCRNRKTVVFLPLVSTSRRFCEMLNSIGLSACEVNGETPDRGKILRDFADGRYKVLCNAMLLTEGWDQPDVDCIVVLRPTKVRSLYQQMVGRGTRLAPGKKDLLLLDFLWMSAKHNLCTPASLMSGDESIAKRVMKELEKGDAVDLMEADSTARKDSLAERESSLAGQLEQQRQKKGKLVDPLQFILSIEDEDLASYQPTFRWEFQPPTEKQLSYLEKLGIERGSVSTMGMASMLISRLRDRYNAGLSTPRQIRALEKYGFEHVGTWPKEAASRMMDYLSVNGWRLPKGVNPAAYRPQDHLRPHS